jgi:hypothetical protein
MGEHDNAGFPLSYCLLTTANAVDQGKRTKALMAWAKCLRDRYSVIPEFNHVDKDMAEIGMIRTVWPSSKISLCWWHLRRAVRTRLAASKVTTTPYNAKRAHEQFGFIDPTFKPHGRVDREEYEGGIPEPEMLEAILRNKTNTTNAGPAHPAHPPHAAPASSLRPTQIPTLRIPPLSQLPSREEENDKTKDESDGTSFDEADTESEGDNSENGEPKKAQRAKRTSGFCSGDLREPIIKMMERHYCAHPLIPGYCEPTPEAIKHWAVQQIYNYCKKHNLRAVWAYLWENWYRAGRWELWARSVHATIPRLKTTMILESQ